MKFKFLIVILIIGFFTASSFAQEKDFGIQISLKESVIWRNAKNIPLKVKVTNKSAKDFNTSELKGIYFSLSRNSKTEKSNLFAADAKIPVQNLKENDSFEFEVNLADLYWQDAKSAFFDF